MTILPIGITQRSSNLPVLQTASAICLTDSRFCLLGQAFLNHQEHQGHQESIYFRLGGLYEFRGSRAGTIIAFNLSGQRPSSQWTGSRRVNHFSVYSHAFSRLGGPREAAHYLSIPIATLRSWVVGRGYPTVSEKKFFKPVIVLPDKRQSLLSFMNLVEAHVLNGIRKKHNVPLPKVRKAVDYLSKQLHSKHPLAEKKLKTDNIDVFIEKFGRLINLSADGQLAMREILEGYLQRIDHDPHGLAARLYPFTRTNGTGDPKAVVIDPRISFGKPVLTGTGIPTAVVGERYKAGESVDELADDYSLPRLQIEEALRYELAA